MEVAVDKTVRQIWAPRVLTRSTLHHLSINEVDTRKVHFMKSADIIRGTHSVILGGVAIPSRSPEPSSVDLNY